MAESDASESATAATAPAPAVATRSAATVAVRDLHIVYRVYGARQVRPGSAQARGNALARLVNKSKKGVTQVHAIRGVTFTAHRGESIGIVGTNGSGKSTLLRAIAGTLPPERGEVLSKSRPTLLGVNAALVPQLTGARNVELGCLALGMTSEEARERFSEIVEFSGIGEFIDLPMTAYSSGMSARLRFAIASSVPHEVLLIDEALATGDVHFRVRSEKRILELREEANTVFLVSHEIGSVLETCNRGIWLDRGQIRMDGPVAEVAEAYESAARSGGTKAAQAVTSMAGAGVIHATVNPDGATDTDTATATAGATATATDGTDEMAQSTAHSGLEQTASASADANPPWRMRTRWLAPITALISLAVFAIGSWQPVYWLDEATTLAAVRRSWPDVLRLFNGDPSLVPYYVLMKPFAALSEAEAWMRLPGEVAAAAAVTLLVIALNRLLGARSAILAGCTWLAIPGVSLCAQMIRPYAFVMLLVVICGIAWWRSMPSKRRWWSLVYAAAYFGVGAMNMYALTIALPIAVAAWFAPVVGRRTTMLRTLIPIAIAIAILSPYIVLAALRAPGPGQTAAFDPGGILSTFVGAVDSPWLLAVLVLLSLIALTGYRTASQQVRRLMLLTGIGALILPILLACAQGAGLKTLAAPYFIFTMPALATLAALGLARVGSRWWPVSLAGLVVVVAIGMPSQLQVRTPNGHRGHGARQIAAAVQVPALANLPVVANPPTLVMVDLAAYAPAVVSNRMPYSINPDSKGQLLIHPPPDSAAVATLLSDYPAVVLLTAPSSPTNVPRPDVTVELQENGFTLPWVTCADKTKATQIQVLARAQRTTRLPSRDEIAGQVQQAAPSLTCVAG